MLPSLTGLPLDIQGEATHGLIPDKLRKAVTPKQPDLIQGLKKLLIQFYKARLKSSSSRVLEMASAFSALTDYWEEHKNDLSNVLPKGDTVFANNTQRDKREAAYKPLEDNAQAYYIKVQWDCRLTSTPCKAREWADCYVESLKEDGSPCKPPKEKKKK